jgi:hypothetical protein
MKRTILSDVTPYSLSSPTFLWTYFLHLRGRRVSQAGNQKEPGSKESELCVENSVQIYARKGTQRELPASCRYSSILEIASVRFSEMSANFYRTTRRHIPEDSTFPVITSGVYNSLPALLFPTTALHIWEDSYIHSACGAEARGWQRRVAGRSGGSPYPKTTSEVPDEIDTTNPFCHSTACYHCLV